MVMRTFFCSEGSVSTPNASDDARCAVHDPPGDHGKHEQFASFTHAGDIYEDYLVVMEVAEYLRHAEAGFTEELAVPLHDVSYASLDDL